MNVERTLPNAAAAEAALVYCGIQYPGEVIPRTLDVVPEMFYNSAHQRLWQVIQDLHETGHSVDPVTIRAALTTPTDREQVELVFNQIITGDGGLVVSVPDYVEAIRDTHRRRQVIANAHRLTEAAFDAACDMAAAEADAVQRLASSGRASSPVAISLGDVVADKLTNGGSLWGQRYLCRGGALSLIAPTGIGKSVLTLQAGILSALGRCLFGIKTAGKLRVLIIQAENDAGDVVEIRDGIVAGLELTPEEAADAFSRVLIVTVNDTAGAAFVRLLDALLALNKPDLVIIDPLFAYCGCNVSDQEAMSLFLRVGINPVLTRHNCGLVLVHHSNKPPTGKEKTEWKAGDLAYLGSGSAELANWSRAVIGIRSIGEHNVFQVVLGKRGKRAGIVDDNGDAVFAFHIKHAAHGICWQLADPDDLPDTTTGTRSKITTEAVADAIGTSKVTHGELCAKLADAYHVTDRTARKAIAAALTAGSVTKTASKHYEAAK